MDTPNNNTVAAKPITVTDDTDQPQKVVVRFRQLPNLSEKPSAVPSAQRSSSLPGKLVFYLLGTITWLRAKLSRVIRYKAATNGSTHRSLELNLTMPAIPKLPTRTSFKILLDKLRRLPPLTVVKIAVAAVLLITLGHYLLSGHKAKAPTITPTATTQKLSHGTPRYTTVLPAGKSINQLGGWTRVSPPDRNPVYAFVDKVGTVSLTVSEQPLPANLQHDSDQQISELAQNFSATDKISANGLTAYIGTSAKGPQSVILTKNNLLILIKSETALTNAQWVTYVSSLQ